MSGRQDFKFGWENGGGLRYYIKDDWGVRTEYRYTVSGQNFGRILAGVFYQFSAPWPFLPRGGAKRVSFLPVLIDKQLRPEVLRKGDARFDDAVRFMEWVSEDHPQRFAVDGDEVVVA